MNELSQRTWAADEKHDLPDLRYNHQEGESSRTVYVRTLRMDGSALRPEDATQRIRMIITVARTNKTLDGIFGNLKIDISSFKCVTEENLALCIPPGTYDVLFMWSDKFQQFMPHIMTPDRTAIEIHWANYPIQEKGCLALGTETELAADRIDQSKIAWIGFMKAISDQPAIKIKIVEDYLAA